MTCCYVVEPNAGEDDRETARQESRICIFGPDYLIRISLIRENKIGDENPITYEEY